VIDDLVVDDGKAERLAQPGRHVLAERPHFPRDRNDRHSRLPTKL
jgi:hypothetical protein